MSPGSSVDDCSRCSPQRICIAPAEHVDRALAVGVVVRARARARRARGRRPCRCWWRRRSPGRSRGRRRRRAAPRASAPRLDDLHAGGYAQRDQGRQLVVQPLRARGRRRGRRPPARGGCPWRSATSSGGAPCSRARSRAGRDQRVGERRVPRAPAATNRSFMTADARRASASTTSRRPSRSRPRGRPASRAISWMPSRSGSAISARLQREQLLVGRRDLVEVAVAAHQRQQVVEVLLADHA